jgi:hypothetical protein
MRQVVRVSAGLDVTPIGAVRATRRRVAMPAQAAAWPWHSGFVFTTPLASARPTMVAKRDALRKLIADARDKGLIEGWNLPPVEVRDLITGPSNGSDNPPKS